MIQDKWTKSPSATKTEINNNQPFWKIESSMKWFCYDRQKSILKVKVAHNTFNHEERDIKLSGRSNPIKVCL